jgi:hypothetical protein
MRPPLTTADRPYKRSSASSAPLPGRPANRYAATKGTRRGPRGRSELIEFRAKLIEHEAKSRCSGAIGSNDSRRRTGRFDDEVDRAVLQMQPPPIRQHADLRALRVVHAQAFSRSGGWTGHGLPSI